MHVTPRFDTASRISKYTSTSENRVKKSAALHEPPAAAQVASQVAPPTPKCQDPGAGAGVGASVGATVGVGVAKTRNLL